MLVCKIFLHYLMLLVEWEGMLDLWLRILDILDRMMNSGQGDTLEEAVPESLKNILLVMASQGILVRPEREDQGQDQDLGKERLWTETRKRMERFMPQLWEDIFPERSQVEAEPPPPPEQGQTEEIGGQQEQTEKVAEPTVPQPVGAS